MHCKRLFNTINTQSGLKVAIDIPSGLSANTGQPLPVAVKADQTLTVLGLKAGLFTGQGREYTGQIELISVVPSRLAIKSSRTVVTQTDPIATTPSVWS